MEIKIKDLYEDNSVLKNLIEDLKAKNAEKKSVMASSSQLAYLNIKN